MKTGIPCGADGGSTRPLIQVESDTPRTDAAGLLGFAETADLCEKLERELTEQSLVVNRYREALQRIATAECYIAQEALRGH